MLYFPIIPMNFNDNFEEAQYFILGGMIKIFFWGMGIIGQWTKIYNKVYKIILS